MFKSVAENVDKKSFDDVTRESIITDLGIDSLSMMQIVGDMETELDLQIPDEDLVEIVTVGDLCSKLEHRIGA
ncbi:MAG: phosphopantetheine-binding protein [Polyangiaceae bacterium]